MTKIFLSAFVFLSSQAFAQNYEDNIIEALHYRSASHAAFASVNIVDWLHESQTFTQDGSSFDTYSRTSLQSNAVLDYGLTDEMQIGISENYVFGIGTDRTIEPSGATSSYTTKGFSDPTLSFNYRYMGGLTGTHFGSLVVNLTPAIGHQQDSTTSTTGNNLSAASTILVGTNLYWVLGKHEFAVEPLVRYITAGTNSDPDNGRFNSDFDSRINYAVNTNYRLHFAEKFYVGASASFNGPNTTYFSFGGRNPVSTERVSSPVNVSPGVNFGWRVCPNALLSASFSYSGYTQTTTQTSAVDTTSHSSFDEDVATLTGAVTF